MDDHFDLQSLRRAIHCYSVSQPVFSFAGGEGMVITSANPQGNKTARSTKLIIIFNWRVGLRGLMIIDARGSSGLTLLLPVSSNECVSIIIHSNTSVYAHLISFLWDISIVLISNFCSS